MSIWVKLGAVAVVLVAFTSWHIYDKHEAVQAARTQVELEYSQQLKESRDKSAATEKELRDSLSEALEKKNEQIKDISNKLDSTLSSLQFYKKCSELQSKPTSITAPCPSRELSREDAEFLAREAARAQEVVKERDFYYERYERARKALDSQ